MNRRELIGGMVATAAFPITALATQNKTKFLSKEEVAAAISESEKAGGFVHAVVVNPSDLEEVLTFSVREEKDGIMYDYGHRGYLRTNDHYGGGGPTVYVSHDVEKGRMHILELVDNGSTSEKRPAVFKILKSVSNSHTHKYRAPEFMSESEFTGKEC